MSRWNHIGEASLLVAAVFLGCGPADDGEQAAEIGFEAPADGEQSLQGGRATSAHKSIGLVLTTGGSICTGTLIKPRVVLTAAHCVRDEVQGFYTGRGRAVADDGSDGLGLDAALSLMEEHPVREQVAHPGYRIDFCGASPDLALLHLYGPVDGIRPLKVARASAAKPGRLCTAVGFGVHGQGGNATIGRKRSGREEIVRVLRKSVEVRRYSAVADHGDSGGPLLCGGKIAGVTSCGGEDAPETRHIWYARPDQEAAWMRGVLEEWGEE